MLKYNNFPRSVAYLFLQPPAWCHQVQTKSTMLYCVQVTRAGHSRPFPRHRSMGQIFKTKTQWHASSAKIRREFATKRKNVLC